MLRAILYNDNAQHTVREERVYKSHEEWDLSNEMKLWFEYPESTRFARYPYDVLYVPIFFGNEPIIGDLCLEANTTVADEIPQLTAEVSLVGSASLGMLNIGGRSANIYDARYSFSMAGFRTIVSIPVLDVFQTVSMDAGAYERSSVHGRRVPFSFRLPTRTLNQLRELTPSLKLISSDTEATLDMLKGRTSTMLISVRYMLHAVLFNGDEMKQKIEQEIRIWVSLDEQQVPSPLPAISERVTQLRRSSIIPLKRARSFSLSSSRRKSIHDGGQHIIIEADDPSPFTFHLREDAAATKVQLTLTHSTTGEGAGSNPGQVQGTIEWLMKSLTTIAVQPNTQEEGADSEDYFHLRTRHLPLKKLKMNWTNWTKEEVGNGWSSTQDIWLTLSTTNGLTPTFRTSFIAHSYSIWLNVSLSGKGLKGKSNKIDLNVPVKVRYELGLVPSYTHDHTLPGYEVDEGQSTQQPGSGDIFAEPPPPHEDADTHLRPRRPIPRYTPDELAELIRDVGLEDENPRRPDDPPPFSHP